MTDIQRLGKLINRLNHFINHLDRLNALCVHQTIDQSYYMQKVAELQFLHDRLNSLSEMEKATCDLVAAILPTLSENWKRDIRWLQKYSLEKFGTIIDLEK